MTKIIVDNIPLAAENCPFAEFVQMTSKYKCLLKSGMYSRCKLDCNEECDELTEDKMLVLANWTEVTKGLYRYVIAANVAYEIHIIYWESDTDILTAKASLYIVGDWRQYDGKSFFERELLLEEQPVFECLVAAEKDDKENNNA